MNNILKKIIFLNLIEKDQKNLFLINYKKKYKIYMFKEKNNNLFFYWLNLYINNIFKNNLFNFGNLNIFFLNQQINIYSLIYKNNNYFNFIYNWLYNVIYVLYNRKELK